VSGKKHGVPFTAQSAPRQGGKPGRRVKLSSTAMAILNKLLADWERHGGTTLKILRMENPAAYAKLALECATRLTLAEMGADGDMPTIITVKWVDPKQHPALPLPPEKPWTPDVSPPPAPAMTQPSPPRVLTLLPRPPA
jgi:hypothetical protein